jgi:hypothetical protein
LNENACHDFPVIQYVDDTLVGLMAQTLQLICLKAILQTFATSTGLKVNYEKSSMMPINVLPDRLIHFARSIQCKAGSIPFILDYLLEQPSHL